ncbi:MAG TPA: hypothetical protein VGQ83_03300 [Polyangia bacterium]|jgi:hypothetical protein
MKRVLLVLVAAGLVVAGVALVNQVRGGAPARRAAAPAPLTDIAAQPRPVAVGPDEGPARRLAALPAATQPAAGAPPVVPPSQMPDPARPPHWTGTPPRVPPTPTPPNPFVPPPIAQDPERGRPQDPR